jgi:hypothetical protein
MTVSRIVAAFVIALIVGVLVGPKLALESRHKAHDHSDDGCHNASESNKKDQDQLPKGSGLVQALRYSFVDMIDHLGPWIIAGIVAAALLQPLIGPEFLSTIPPSLQIIVTVLLSAPGYVCASAATPIAAILLINGLSPGAALAFLIAGPATNLTTFGMLKDTHSTKSAIHIILTIVFLSVLVGFLTNALIPDSLTSLIDIQDHQPRSYELVAAGLFSALLLLSIFRIGPRGFLAQLGLSDIHEHQHGAMSNQDFPSAPEDHSGHHH